jgi:DNA-binding NtrC family response regulator
MKILIVEDDEIMRDSLEMALMGMGDKIVTASDGMEAIRQIENDSIGFVIMDIMLPQINGLAVLSWIKKTTPDMPVIMITGYHYEVNRQLALKLGAIDCLEKPFNLPKLINMVKNVLKSKKEDESSK